MANPTTFSILGKDVSVQGDLNAATDLHIDGSVMGDITCARLAQGETSRIEGAIRVESARLAGFVSGTVTAKDLVILKSARIEGEVHYETLTIELGARVEGRFVPDGAARETNIVSISA